LLDDITEVEVYTVNCVIYFPLCSICVKPKLNYTTFTKFKMCYISDSQHVTDVYSTSNSSKSPSSGAGNVSEPRLMSQVGRVRVDQCVSAVRAISITYFVRVCSLS
jgi:hypothetical protein